MFGQLVVSKFKVLKLHKENILLGFTVFMTANESSGDVVPHHTMLLGYILILFRLEVAKSVESVMLAISCSESLLNGVREVKV